MEDKIYDITGYICGHRVSNLLKYNKLRSDYRDTFLQFHTQSRHDSGSTAVEKGLPARYLLFRQHSEGLYFSRLENYNFIKVIQTIFMQSSTTDVLILFNSIEPVKKQHNLVSFLQWSHEWSHQSQNIGLVRTIIEIQHWHKFGLTRSTDRRGWLNNRFLELKVETNFESSQQHGPIDNSDVHFSGRWQGTVLAELRSKWGQHENIASCLTGKMKWTVH